jgi:hypothetical protein
VFLLKLHNLVNHEPTQGDVPPIVTYCIYLFDAESNIRSGVRLGGLSCGIDCFSNFHSSKRYPCGRLVQDATFWLPRAADRHHLVEVSVSADLTSPQSNRQRMADKKQKPRKLSSTGSS